MNEKVVPDDNMVDGVCASSGLPSDSEVDNAVCTDIAARDEFDPTKHVQHEQIKAQAQRMSDVRSRFENLGADMQHIMTLLYGLQDRVSRFEQLFDEVGAPVKGMSVRELEQFEPMYSGQENMRAAGKTVDDLYCRIIDLENEVESVREESISSNDYDPDEWVRQSDLDDEVTNAIQERVTFNAEITAEAN